MERQMIPYVILFFIRLGQAKPANKMYAHRQAWMK